MKKAGSASPRRRLQSRSGRQRPEQERDDVRGRALLQLRWRSRERRLAELLIAAKGVARHAEGSGVEPKRHAASAEENRP
jgi:hypothetical protein